MASVGVDASRPLPETKFNKVSLGQCNGMNMKMTLRVRTNDYGPEPEQATR